MELEDSLYPLLREVSIGIDPYEVFKNAEWALLIGAKPRGPGMERADLLDINGQIFAQQVIVSVVIHILHHDDSFIPGSIPIKRKCFIFLLSLLCVAGQSSKCGCIS